MSVRPLLVTLLVLEATTAAAETVVALRPIRAGNLISETDVGLQEDNVGGALDTLAGAVGMQAARNLIPGRPIYKDDVQRPHLVERNQLVTVSFQKGGLTITTDGRALDGGAAGEIIRVLNASSHTTLFGTVLPDGTIAVNGAE